MKAVRKWGRGRMGWLTSPGDLIFVFSPAARCVLGNAAGSGGIFKKRARMAR